MIGQSIGQYKILEKLGEGGMGVVYKAHDTKLDRMVALKFLPHHLTIHDEERARFLQEARAASALNHANVCVIHDLQEYNGEHFIVMEFVEGGTLREKISAALLTGDRVMPLDTVITYAIQIGEALQEAHSKGIVHRDVKAENIMVTGKNQIKVMDFGLAKLKGSLKLTRTSSTVGTLAYMAPEQIQGGEVDARSDIFSFGVVLYEMLAGQTPFRGGHEAAMMYSILNEDPEPLEKFRPGISSELLHVLDRSLEKNPDERYQSIGEMVIDLRRMKRHSTRVSRSIDISQAPPAVSREETLAQATAGTSTKKRRLPLAIGGFVLIVAVIVWYLLRGAGSSGIVGKLNPNMTFRVLQIPFSQIFYPGLSGDGNWIGFPAVGVDGKWDVYFMNSLGGEPRRVTSDSSLGMSQADVSSDGSKIAYDRFNSQSGTMEIASISSLGGVSRRVAVGAYLPRWTPNGERIGYLRQGRTGNTPSPSGKLELWSVKPDGSDTRQEFVDSISVIGRVSFSWSPDGKSVAWIRSFTEAYQEVITRELATGKERQLTFDKKNVDEVCWTRQGEVIFSSNKNGNMNLWMVPAIGGEATQLTKGSGPDFGVKISTDGSKLLFFQYRPVQNIWIAGIDGSNAHSVTSEDRRLEAPAFSPNGKQIVFSAYDPDAAKGNRSIYIMERNGSNRREITAGDGIAELPQWSPDGKWVAFITHSTSEPHDSARVALIEATNPGAPRITGKGLIVQWADSQTLIVSTGKRTYTVPVNGGEAKTFYEDTARAAVPVLRGKYALVFPIQPPFRDVRLLPVSGEKLEWNRAVTLIQATWNNAAIAPDGSSLLLSTGPNQLLKISLPGGLTQVLPKTFTGLDPTSVFNISYDGREVIYTDRKENGKLVMIENMR
jgi:serine/threonine protein kinase/dipeptidyl aminopeptidase/acylaminoacyl peptidase